MKKCTQCGQTLNDDLKFCFKCGGANFEPVAEAAPQPAQQAYQQPSQQPYYQQPAQQQAYYQQPAYQQPVYNNSEPATIGDYLLFALFMIIPIFNLVYMIMVAVGAPKYKKSMTNYARAMLIILGIAIILNIIIFGVIGVSFANMYSYGY
ncbi:hypothetical protein AAFA46_00930 [Oscillospiraceae bacterium WX1]